MHGFAQGAVVGAFATLTWILPGSGTAPSARIQTGPATAKDPAPILAAARQALGGDAKLSAIKSFTVTGRTRQVRGENLVPIEFEILVELPDKYLRKDEIPAQETGPNASGFNGDDLLQDPAPAAPSMPPPAAPPAAPAGAVVPPGRGPMGTRNPSAARVLTLKQDFTRLMLGMFAASFSAYPLTFTYVGEAEAPQGKADVLDAKGPNNFTLRLFISRDTHLPLMVSWQGSAAPGRGRPPGAPAPVGDRGTPPPAGERGMAPPAPQAPPENRLYFADYRDVNGVQFPFRLRRAVGADTTEETTFDRFKLNAKIDPKRFEVRK